MIHDCCQDIILAYTHCIYSPSNKLNLLFQWMGSGALGPHGHPVPRRVMWVQPGPTGRVMIRPVCGADYHAKGPQATGNHA